MAEAATAESERKRSPGYPVIDLSQAITKVKVLWEADGVAASPANVIAEHWGSKTTSSAFMQWIASLKRFGLLIESPSATGVRQLKPSQAAVDILVLEEQDPRRLARIKQVALLPDAHAELWKMWGLNLPSDANLLHHFVSTKGFKKDAAKELIEEYRRTIAFAKLDANDTLAITEAVGVVVEPPGNGMPGAVQQPPANPAGDGRASQRHQQRRPMTGETTEDVFTLDEGPVVLQIPSRLSADSYEDLKTWMELQLRKIKRSIVQPDQKKSVE